jgi:hypothetical protein
MPIGQAKFGLLGGVADLGKLELIETQTASGTVEFIEFTNLQESTYNVHLLTVNNLHLANNSSLVQSQFSTNGGTSYINTQYQYAQQRCQANGTFADDKSVGTSSLQFVYFAGNGTGETCNFYAYFYNLGDNTKYSYVTMHNNYMISGVAISSFGGGALLQTNTINAFRLQSNVTNNFTDYDISLYGIAES